MGLCVFVCVCSCTYLLSVRFTYCTFIITEREYGYLIFFKATVLNLLQNIGDPSFTHQNKLCLSISHNHTHSLIPIRSIAPQLLSTPISSWMWCVVGLSALLSTSVGGYSQSELACICPHAYSEKLCWCPMSLLQRNRFPSLGLFFAHKCCICQCTQKKGAGSSAKYRASSCEERVKLLLSTLKLSSLPFRWSSWRAATICFS